MQSDDNSMSFFPMSLHEAIVRGDPNAVLKALAAGEDINSLDENGKNVVICAILGHETLDPETIASPTLSFPSPKRLQILSEIILPNPELSLYTLNAPQNAAKGTTALALAAWLNKPEDVRALLDVKPGLVAVDCRDGLDATPLMYAARDGNIQIVQDLLSHNARPDLTDVNFRSAIHYSLRFPQIVWLLEVALRRQRARRIGQISEPSDGTPSDISNDDAFQANPPPHTAFSPYTLKAAMHPILSAITTNEISILNTLLFPPPSLTTPPSDLSPIILINWLDSKGLAPIHYAVSVEKPKIEIIDALYKAGADMNFCASWKKSTALHCLARFARDEHLSTNPDPPTMEKLLFYFTVHLVKHLKASLAARDSSGESCLHIAAEHGESAAVLRALIYCDEDRSVREMRNDRGFRPIDLAKTRFLSLFDASFDNLTSEDHLYPRPQSTASIITVTPENFKIMSNPSSASSSSTSLHILPSSRNHSHHFMSKFQVHSSTRKILENLARSRFLSLSEDLDSIQRMLGSTAEMSSAVLGHWRAKLERMKERFDDVRDLLRRTGRRVEGTRRLVEERMEGEGKLKRKSSEKDWHSRTRSEDIPRNLNPRDGHPRSMSLPTIPLTTFKSYRHVGILTAFDSISDSPSTGQAPRSPATPEFSLSPTWPQPFVLLGDSTTYLTHKHNLVEVEKDLEIRTANLAMLKKQEDAALASPVTLESNIMVQTLMMERRAEEKARLELLDEKRLLQWYVRALEASESVVNNGYSKDGSGNGAMISGSVKPRRLSRERLRFRGLEIVYEMSSGDAEVGRDVKVDRSLNSGGGSSPCRELGERDDGRKSVGRGRWSLLRVANGVLDKVDAELELIEGRMEQIEHLIDNASRSIDQAQHEMDKAIQSRIHQVNDRWAIGTEDRLLPKDWSSHNNILASPPSTPSSSSMSLSSAPSSPSSLSASFALMGVGEYTREEDAYTLEKLLMGKIADRVETVFSSVEKMREWIDVVREVLRNLKRGLAL